MSELEFKKGLVELGEGVWAYIQPDGSWGLSNAGLLVDHGKSLLIDTLYDVKLTDEMLAEMRTQALESFQAAKDIPLGPYADYHDPEKILINVNALYKEFSNDPEPLNPVEQFTAMANW